MGHVSDVQLGVAHPIPTGAVILATCASRFWQRPLRTPRAVKNQNPVLLSIPLRFVLFTLFFSFFFFLILFVSSKCLIFIELIQCSWLGSVFFFFFFLRNIFISIVICKILNKVFFFHQCVWIMMRIILCCCLVFIGNVRTLQHND